MNMLNYWTNIRRHRVANRDITLLAHRDFLAPVSDNMLLNLANVPEDSHTKPRSTLFGPLLEQPRGSASGQNKKPLPVEKKVIAPAIVQSWVDRSQNVSRPSLMRWHRVLYDHMLTNPDPYTIPASMFVLSQIRLRRHSMLLLI